MLGRDAWKFCFHLTLHNNKEVLFPKTEMRGYLGKSNDIWLEGNYNRTQVCFDGSMDDNANALFVV